MNRPDLERPWAPPEPEVVQLDPRFDPPKCDRVRCEEKAAAEVYDRPMCADHASWALAGLVEDCMDWAQEVNQPPRLWRCTGPCRGLFKVSSGRVFAWCPRCMDAPLERIEQLTSEVLLEAAE